MKLPNVLSVDTTNKDKAILEIETSPELEAFDGHFPGNPVLPGVVQIDWAMRFAAIHLGIQETGVRNIQVKFRNIIRPNIPISLTLQFDHSKNQLSFAYQSGDAPMSSGQLRLDTKA